MKVGHVFTVEPVLAEANAEATKWPDGWTYATIDGSWTAQFEHTPGPTDPRRSPKPPPVFSEGIRSPRIFFSRDGNQTTHSRFFSGQNFRALVNKVAIGRS